MITLNEANGMNQRMRSTAIGPDKRKRNTQTTMRKQKNSRNRSGSGLAGIHENMSSLNESAVADNNILG